MSIFENMPPEVVGAIYTDIWNNNEGQKKYFEYINE